MWHPLPNPPPPAGEGVARFRALSLSLPHLWGRVGEGVAFPGGT